jgi:hypothetical protein
VEERQEFQAWQPVDDSSAAKGVELAVRLGLLPADDAMDD